MIDAVVAGAGISYADASAKSWDGLGLKEQYGESPVMGVIGDLLGLKGLSGPTHGAGRGEDAALADLLTPTRAGAKNNGWSVS